MSATPWSDAEAAAVLVNDPNVTEATLVETLNDSNALIAFLAARSPFATTRVLETALEMSQSDGPWPSNWIVEMLAHPNVIEDLVSRCQSGVFGSLIADLVLGSPKISRRAFDVACEAGRIVRLEAMAMSPSTPADVLEQIDGLLVHWTNDAWVVKEPPTHPSIPSEIAPLVAAGWYVAAAQAVISGGLPETDVPAGGSLEAFVALAAYVPGVSPADAFWSVS